MRVFLTGATGFIGARIVPELLAAGHQVIGMTRSEAGADTLRAAGAEPHFATLEDLAAIKAGAERADAIIHCAFDHDFSNFVANCEKDRRVIETLGAVLKGSDRPLLITSGVGMGDAHDGKPATEANFDRANPNPRVISELTGDALLQEGVNVSVMRLPQVHDTVKQGLISYSVQIALQTGKVAYVGDGANRWSAAPVGDVAHLYALAIARAEPGARYNAVAEEGVSARAIADVLGAGLDLPVVSLTPEEADTHFGWFALFASLDMAASSAWTRATLGWTPTGPSLLEDLRNMDYAAISRA